MNIDKTRKVVSIVLMVLMIGTLVFNAFHLVGHCASETYSYVNSYPMPFGYGSGFGMDSVTWEKFANYDFEALINYAQSEGLNTAGIDTVVIQEIGNTYITIGLVKSSSYNLAEPFPGWVTFTYRYLIRLYASDLSFYGFWGGGNGSYGTQYSSENIYVVGSGIPSNTFIVNYPIWSSVDNISVGDTVVYSKYIPEPEFGGHSKGGTITEYSFDQTDEAAPTDPSAVAGSGGWLSKILGGLNKLNKTVGDGFLNLVDNLQSFFNPIFGAFEQQIDNFKSSIESKLDDIILALGGDLNSSDTSLSDTFLTAFQGSKSYGVVTTYNQGKQLVTGIFNSVPTPTALRFEFDLPTMNLSGGHSQGGSSSATAVKPYGNKLVMDFGWYENVRSIVVPFIISWLYAGMLIWILRAIPGFISGSPSINTRSVSDGSPIINGHNEVYEYTDYQGQHHKKPIFRL